MFYTRIFCDGKLAMDSVPCKSKDAADFLGQLGVIDIMAYGVSKERVTYKVLKVK